MLFYRGKCPLISLCYLKKRLRHITTFGVHDLVVTKIHFTVHFTLHVSRKTIAFYTSESIENLRCPEWRYLTFPLPYQYLQDFIMRIWITNSNDCYLAVEYDIHLDNTLIPDEQKAILTKKENTLWLIMFGYRFTDTDDETRSQVNLSKERFEFEKSYDKSSINRIISTFNQIREYQQNSSIQLQLIDECLEKHQDYFNKLNECETRRIRIETLKQYIEYRRDIIQQLRQNCDEKKQLIEDRYNQLNEQLPQLERFQNAINHALYRFQQSESILRNYLFINKYRCQEIVSQIYRYVYPIEKDNRNRYSINNIHLPQANDDIFLSKLNQEREREIVAAIKYCCHLISIISNFLDLPLRYPIDFYGQSEMKIYDLNSEPYEYLLQPTTNLNGFVQGFFLLNSNIGQIMFHCRIGKRDDAPENTLANLKTLIEQYFVNAIMNMPIRPSRTNDSMMLLERSSISSSSSLLENNDRSNSNSNPTQSTTQISRQIQK